MQMYITLLSFVRVLIGFSKISLLLFGVIIIFVVLNSYQTLITNNKANYYLKTDLIKSSIIKI